MLWNRGFVLRSAGDPAVALLVFETKNPMEARRARRALFRALSASLNLGGQPVTGIVKSVMEDRTDGSSTWIVKVEPKAPASRHPRQRYNPYGEQKRYG